MRADPVVPGIARPVTVAVRPLPAVTTTGSLQVNCSNGLAYSLDLDAGANPAAANANRQLASGANRLGYNIYTTNTFITVWGSTMAGGTSQS